MNKYLCTVRLSNIDGRYDMESYFMEVADTLESASDKAKFHAEILYPKCSIHVVDCKIV